MATLPARIPGSRAAVPPTAIAALAMPKSAPSNAAPLPPFFSRNREGSPAIDRAAQGTKELLPVPEWIRRPGGSRNRKGHFRKTWVTHYRIWKPGLYEGEGIVSEWRIDFRFDDGHEHWYTVPHQVATAARNDPTGSFVHRVLLGEGWNNKNGQSRYANGPLN
jgi:hypothetical protein